MKTIILFLVLSPLMASAQNEGFLSKSKLLVAAGVKIIPAQIVDKNRILPIFDSGSPNGFFLIGESGLQNLEKIKGAKKVKLKIRTCGADELSSPWTLKGKSQPDGIFLASGKKIENLEMKWFPAKEEKLKEHPECVIYNKNYELTSFHVASVEGVKGRVFYSEQKSPELLKFEKEYRAQKDHDKSYPKIDCQKTDLAFQKIGFLDGGKCQILFESPVNCEGQGYKQGSFSKPLGLIEISKGTEVEKWLVFLAFGYEGDAFLGIKINGETIPKSDADIDFYVYSGC